MTEALCQNALFFWCDRKRHRHIVPNVTLFGWESDLVSVTKAGLICEFEIKCSRADFRADAKKERHALFRGELPAWKEKGPSYFYYALRAEVNVAVEEEIPAYAGMLLLHGKRLVTVVKPAPRLHKIGMSDNQRQWLERSIIHRYWKHRLQGFNSEITE